jgi:ribosome-binding protein aMBF1 (putative translation factor)
MVGDGLTRAKVSERKAIVGTPVCNQGRHVLDSGQPPIKLQREEKTMTGKPEDPTAVASNWYGEDMSTFGDRLTAAREAAGLSTVELASRIGVKTKVIQQWEADSKEPRSNRLQMLSGILGVSLVWLLTGEGEGVANPEEARTTKGQDMAVLNEIRSLRHAAAALNQRLGQLELMLEKSAGDFSDEDAA